MIPPILVLMTPRWSFCVEFVLSQRFNLQQETRRSPANDGVAPTELWFQHRGVDLDSYEIKCYHYQNCYSSGKKRESKAINKS